MDIATEDRRVDGIPVLEFHDRDAGGRLPLVFVLHGFSGSKDDSRARGDELARGGYHVVAVDLHLHGELGEAPFDPPRVGQGLLEVVERSVENLAVLASAYRDSPVADAGRIGLLGISLGGVVIYHYLPQRAAGVRAAACMIAGPPQIAASTLRNVQAVYPEFGVTDALIAASRDVPFLEDVGDLPLLVQVGEADPIVPIDGVRRVVHEARSHYTCPERLQLVVYEGVGHETPPAMFARAYEWFGKYL